MVDSNRNKRESKVLDKEEDFYMKMNLLTRLTAGVAAAGLVFCATVAHAQISTTPQLPYGASDIIKLSQAKAGDDTIIAYIHNNGNSYGLSADQIIYMQQQGVSGPVLTAMLSQPRPGVLPEQAPEQPVATSAAQYSTAQYTSVPQPTTPAPQPDYSTAAPSVTYVQPAPTTYYYYSSSYPVYYPSYAYYPYYSCGYPCVSFGIGFGRGGFCGWRGGSFCGGFRGGFVGGFHGGFGGGGFHGGFGGGFHGHR